MFWMFLVWNVIGCSHMRHVKRLETPEKNHWSALRVFMKEDQKKEFLMYKTRVERDSYLKDQGLWDKYYNIDEKRREEILSYNVQEGWNQEELLMSWGRPYQTQMEPESKNGIGAERWIINLKSIQIKRQVNATFLSGKNTPRQSIKQTVFLSERLSLMIMGDRSGRTI
jgi:hypothetical protein